MTKHTMSIGAIAVLLIFFVANCAQKPEAAVPAPAPSVHLPQSVASTGKAGWEEEWNRTVLAAKKESEVLVYMHVASGARIPISEAFTKKFGIKMDAVTAPSPLLQARINSEYRAGIHQVDVYIGGTGIVVNTKPLGYLSPLEPALILPEVTDPKAWLGGQVPFFDRDRTMFLWLSQVSPGIIYNTDMVKKGEIGSYLDLLKPEWKEKIISSDPRVELNAIGDMHVLVEQWGLDKAKEYLTRLVKEQKVVVTRDQFQGPDWVARGKAWVGVLIPGPTVIQLVKEGAPLATPLTKEPKQITASNGGLAIPSKPAHPNAAKVFVNWLFSREGQIVAAEAFGAKSARVDVLPKGVPEIVAVQSGQTYVYQSEARNEKRVEYIPDWERILAQ